MKQTHNIELKEIKNALAATSGNTTDRYICFLQQKLDSINHKLAYGDLKSTYRKELNIRKEAIYDLISYARHKRS